MHVFGKGKCLWIWMQALLSDLPSGCAGIWARLSEARFQSNVISSKTPTQKRKISRIQKTLRRKAVEWGQFLKSSANLSKLRIWCKVNRNLYPCHSKMIRPLLKSWDYLSVFWLGFSAPFASSPLSWVWNFLLVLHSLLPPLGLTQDPILEIKPRTSLHLILPPYGKFPPGTPQVSFSLSSLFLLFCAWCLYSFPCSPLDQCSSPVWYYVFIKVQCLDLFTVEGLCYLFLLLNCFVAW